MMNTGDIYNIPLIGGSKIVIITRSENDPKCDPDPRSGLFFGDPDSDFGSFFGDPDSDRIAPRKIAKGSDSDRIAF